MASLWQISLDTALGFFYPEICRFCGVERAAAGEGYVCGRCRAQIRFIRPPFCERCGLPFEGDLTTAFECANCREMKLYFDSARSAVVARGVVREAIHRYKYARELWFEPFLADLLIREAGPALRAGQWDWVVPVPLFPVKEREREFNQAERLAQHLSAAVRIPLQAHLLRRVAPTLTQTQLTREQRAANVRRAFAVRRGTDLQGRRIVLVDDVFTTGATTSACARVLKAAGAERVCVWTVARGL
jgi:competence protein ComFC